MPSKPPAKRKREVMIEQEAKCCLIRWSMCLTPEKPLSVDTRSDEYATWEHLTPRARNGSNAPSNLRLSHKACNRARGERPLPGYEESPPPTREPFVLIDGRPPPEPFTSAWLRWKGYL